MFHVEQQVRRPQGFSPWKRGCVLGATKAIAVRRIPSTPIKVLASAFTECGGGMPANASVAVARLGGGAAYWGRVGDDEVGARIVTELAARGADTDVVRRVPGALSSSDAILVAPNGEQLICAYTDPALDPDPSVAERLPGILEVTLGEGGFLWREGPVERRVSAPKVAAVDTLAAGDVWHGWHGAFTLALGEGREVSEAAKFANAAAARKCTRTGGPSRCIHRKEVSDFLEHQPRLSSAHQQVKSQY